MSANIAPTLDRHDQTVVGGYDGRLLDVHFWGGDGSATIGVVGLSSVTVYRVNWGLRL
jgi:hypothetical protein